MSNRKRVNISLDLLTYERLNLIKEKYGFRNVCGITVALLHILLNRLDKKGEELNLPLDDATYIDSMFDDLGNYENNPDGAEYPVVKTRKHFINH